MSYYLFLDSANCSRFRKYGCGFRKIAYFRRVCERYSVLGICLWNPKQQRRSKKSSKVADSATNLILACCGIRSQRTEFTVWPRNEIIPELFSDQNQYKIRSHKVCLTGNYWEQLFRRAKQSYLSNYQ